MKCTNSEIAINSLDKYLWEIINKHKKKVKF